MSTQITTSKPNWLEAGTVKPGRWRGKTANELADALDLALRQDQALIAAAALLEEIAHLSLLHGLTELRALRDQMHEVSWRANYLHGYGTRQLGAHRQ